MSHVPRSPSSSSQLRTRALFLLTCLVASSALPAAAAWGAKGSWEPDTARDISDHWMFTTPDTAVGGPHKVYFNGFVGTCNWPYCTSLNPNVGQEQSDLHSAQSHNYAMLGVWKDCNNDGYMGWGDQGLWEYRAELLVGPYATGICPVQNPVFGVNPNPSQAIIHNDGAWIHEFIPIQWKSWVGDFNYFNINDNASRVWADGGLPEDDLGGSTGGGGGGCWVSPQPTGTYHNVGGLLYFGDCNTGYFTTDTIDMLGTDITTPGVSREEPLTHTWVNVSSQDTGVGLDNLGLGQVSFSDNPREQWKSGSILNVKPWGETKDGSYAQVWDCSQGTTSVDVASPAVPNPAGGADLVGAKNTHVANYSQPGAPTLGGVTGSSLAGTANATGSGFDQCYRNTHANGQTHYGDELAGAPYTTEGTTSNAAPVPGKSTTLDMTPQEQARPGGPGSLVDKRTPPDFGVHYGSDGGLGAGGQDFWQDNVVLLGDTSTFHYTTYYAYVSAAAVAAYNLALPSGSATGTYGSATCAGHTTGVYKGWQCDPTKWFINSADNSYTPDRSGALGPGPDGKGTDISAKVGRPFDLRDIDCMDLAIGPQRTVGLTPQNVLDQTANSGYDLSSAAEQTATPFVQIVDPAFTSPAPLGSTGNSHHC